MVDKKILPAKIEDFENIPPDYYDDFVKTQIQIKGNKQKLKEILHTDRQKILDEVMRKGQIDLGGRCKVIPCTTDRKPAFCFIFPCEDLAIQNDTGNYICGIRTQQKKRGGLIRSERIEWDTQWPCAGCPYRSMDASMSDEETFHQHRETIWKTLKKRHDYEVKNQNQY